MKDVILEYIRDEYIDEDDDDDIVLDENTPLITSGLVDSFSLVSLKRFLESRYEITGKPLASSCSDEVEPIEPASSTVTTDSSPPEQSGSLQCTSQSWRIAL